MDTIPHTRHSTPSTASTASIGYRCHCCIPINFWPTVAKVCAVLVSMVLGGWIASMGGATRFYACLYGVTLGILTAIKIAVITTYFCRAKPRPDPESKYSVKEKFVVMHRWYKENPDSTVKIHALDIDDEGIEQLFRFLKEQRKLDYTKTEREEILTSWRVDKAYWMELTNPIIYALQTTKVDLPNRLREMKFTAAEKELIAARWNCIHPDKRIDHTDGWNNNTASVFDRLTRSHFPKVKYT